MSIAEFGKVYLENFILLTSTRSLQEINKKELQ